MPRRRRAEVREIQPDSVYGSTLAEKFINSMMWEGKKTASQNIFYGAMNTIQERTNDERSSSSRSGRELQAASGSEDAPRGGANYQVPIEVPQNRRTSLAIRWILAGSRARSEKSMAEKLANELMDAANNRGAAMKKKDDVHRMAEANKAFAHYRW